MTYPKDTETGDCAKSLGGEFIKLHITIMKQHKEIMELREALEYYAGKPSFMIKDGSDE